MKKILVILISTLLLVIHSNVCILADEVEITEDNDVEVQDTVKDDNTDNNADTVSEDSKQSDENVSATLYPIEQEKNYRLSQDGKRLVKYWGDDEVFEIPEGVTEIDCRFYWAQPKKIIIPESVTTIGGTETDGICFSGCTGLEEVEFKGNKLTEIPGGSFTRSGIKKIIIPESVTSIGERAFEGCESLEEVKLPSGLESLGIAAFTDCKKLKSIKLPDSLTEIGQAAFYGCESLNNVTIPSGVKRLGGYMFAECKSLDTLNLPQDIMFPATAFRGTPFDGICNTERYSNLDKLQATPAPSVSPDPNATPAPSVSPDPNVTPAPSAEPQKKTLIVNTAGEGISVTLDGETVKFPDEQPFIDKNDRTQIPIRALLGTAGALVAWLEEEQTVYVRALSGTEVYMKIGSNIMTVDGKEIEMDTEAIIVGDRTFIPVRYLAEAFGFEVIWEK